jgi:hypothetical protein
MSKRKTLAGLRRAREKYRAKVFKEKLDEWEEQGRQPDRLPVLRVYVPGLETMLKWHRLTDEDHIARCGEPWPRPSEPEAPEKRSSLPHVSDVKSIERVQIVRDAFEDDLVDRTNNFMRLNPDWSLEQAREHARGIMMVELAAKPKKEPLIDFDAFEQEKQS